MSTPTQKSLFHVSPRAGIAAGIFAAGAWTCWPELDDPSKFALSLALGFGFLGVVFLCRWMFRKTPVAVHAPVPASVAPVYGPEDDDLYLHAATEIESRDHDAGTMARAWSESGGVQDAASALYIKFRVDRWRQERNDVRQKEAMAKAEARAHAQQESRRAVLRGLAIVVLVAAVILIMAIVASLR